MIQIIQMTSASELTENQNGLIFLLLITKCWNNGGLVSFIKINFSGPIFDDNIM